MFFIIFRTTKPKSEWYKKHKKSQMTKPFKKICRLNHYSKLYLINQFKTMKHIFLIMTILLLVSCKDKQETKNEDTALKVQQYTIEQFMDNEAVGGGSFSHDNSKLLISSNRTGIYNAYTVPVAGGDYIPITASDSTSYF